jgi:hypothetical protein
MMTPPAKVEFKMTSISSSPPLAILETRVAEMTEVVIERRVLITALSYYDPTPIPALKDGQKQNKNNVPNIAM